MMKQFFPLLLTISFFYETSAQALMIRGKLNLAASPTDTSSIIMGFRAAENYDENNTFLGYNRHNTFIGCHAGRNQTEAIWSTYLGSEAGAGTTNSIGVTAVGARAGYWSGATSGIYNIGSTYLGVWADGISTQDVSASTAIGFDSYVTASYQVRLGNTGTESIGGSVSWTNLSDGRFKKNFKEDVPGLEFVLKLRPVTYYLDAQGVQRKLDMISSESLDDKSGSESNALLLKAKQQALQAKSRIRYTGFVAQEVEKAAHEIGFDFSGIDKPQNEDDFYGLRYAEFTVPLVKAVQEQQAIIEEQNKKIEDLEKKVEALYQLMSKNDNISTNPSEQRVATESAASEQDFAVFPNPTSGDITVKFTLKADAKISISIVDESGRLVWQNTLGSLTAGEHSATIDLSQVPNGNYLIQTMLDDQPLTKKIVVQR